MSKLSNLEANLELINLAKSISCLDEFTKQFNNLVSSGCLTNVFRATIDTIANSNSKDIYYDIDEKCIIISNKFNECYVFLFTYHTKFPNISGHILNKNVEQNVLHKLLVMFMYCNHCIYPTKFIDFIDLDKLYLMFINRSRFALLYKHEQIYLHFKNSKVDIDKYNDIIVDNIIRIGDDNLVDLDIFNFTSEQLDILNLYGCLNTIDTIHQTMIDNNFDYDVVKHILDTNPDYTPNSLIYNYVIDYYCGKNVDKIFELLMSRGCYPKYINIVKYVIEHSANTSLETFDADCNNINVSLKSLINNAVVNPDDKKIHIPKYRNIVVLPVNRYFDDDSYVYVNIFLASIIGYKNKTTKVKDFRDIAKQEYNHRTYIYSRTVYMHVDHVYLMNDYTYIKTDNFIDYVLDKYSQ